MYPYGLIGNCQVSALVHSSGTIDWLCMPHPDSPPVFGRLLDPQGGHFEISGQGATTSVQNYLVNTNILETIVESATGMYRIVDFCPRYEIHGRLYRPSVLFRRVEPLQAMPVVQVQCAPVEGWTKVAAKPVRADGHLLFQLRDNQLRLHTNMSFTHLQDGTSFPLTEKLYFCLSWGIGPEGELIHAYEDALARSRLYWQGWVKHCSIPTLFQKETIRAALTLKLHCFEDTGAILAALTTSLPEEIGHNRNWDYRFCWLRDAYYTLTAFHNLGHFEEMENFLKFLLGIVHSSERLRPVYRIDGSVPLPEEEQPAWAGFHNSRPVRTQNQAATHTQNDAYGEMILALAPIYFDERFQHLRTPEHERLLGYLAHLCYLSIGKPDAGLWELRDGWQDHSFTNLMCWAGLDRMKLLRERGYMQSLDFDLTTARNEAEQAVRRAIVDGSVRNGPNDSSFNAALLQMPLLRFPDEALNRRTVMDTAGALSFAGDHGSFLYRYTRPDDFGIPHSAFVLCTFWYAQALSKLGENEKASAVLSDALRTANSLGLISEHFVPGAHAQLGNFPQAYSHVGLINAAFSVSPAWHQIL